MKGIIIISPFQKVRNEYGRKQNKIWLVKESGFYNRSMKSQLQDNDIEMYLIHNEGKFVFAERFVRTLIEQSKHMSLISKNVYIDKLADKYNNA